MSVDYSTSLATCRFLRCLRRDCLTTWKKAAREWVNNIRFAQRSVRHSRTARVAHLNDASFSEKVMSIQQMAYTPIPRANRLCHLYTRVTLTLHITNGDSVFFGQRYLNLEIPGIFHAIFRSSLRYRNKCLESYDTLVFHRAREHLGRKFIQGNLSSCVCIHVS